MLSLAEIKNKYPRTDKNPVYLEAYERHFSARRADVKSVLEVGVQSGDSLRMWRDFFFNATVIGLDIDQHTQFVEPRIEVVIGDVCDPQALNGMNFRGRYDVIIDDGGHKSSQIIDGLANLLPLLMPGGWYCIEDLGTQVWPEYGHHVDRDPHALGHLLALANDLFRKPGVTPKDEVNFSEFHFYPSLAIMRR